MIEHTAEPFPALMSFKCPAGCGGKRHYRRRRLADDTLTEDLDLSYRAQLRGWRFVFLPDLTSPAELPPEMTAFKAQQHRWTKGGAQTCLKLLPRVLRSPAEWWIKLEAFFHLTSCVVYILIVLLSLLLGTALYAKVIIGKDPPWLIRYESVLFVIGFGAPLLFCILSQRALQRGWFSSIKYIPALMAVGAESHQQRHRHTRGFFRKTVSSFARPSSAKRHERPGIGGTAWPVFATAAHGRSGPNSESRST